MFCRAFVFFHPLTLSNRSTASERDKSPTSRKRSSSCFCLKQRQVDYVNCLHTHALSTSCRSLSSDSSYQLKVAEITKQDIDEEAVRFSNSGELQSIDEFSSDVPSLPPDTHQPVENEHLRWL
jgi:hypothetical protein